MKIAVLSGKGGTGKTTVSANLFNTAKRGVLIDTDTEEPNSHIFIKGDLLEQTHVYKNHPIIDYDKCVFCGECGNHCNFNAIIPTKSKVLVFEDLCHDCGMCELVCKSGAISYKEKAIGTISHYQMTKNKRFLSGKLNIGEVSGVRLIDDLKARTENEELLFIDCPPGVSCSTVASLKGVDYAVVVIEPTPFGLSDMKMVVELLRSESIPFGVVINKSDLGNDEVYCYLKEESIPLIAQIPFDKDIARLYSEGKMISNHHTVFKKQMEDILNFIEEVV